MTSDALPPQTSARWQAHFPTPTSPLLLFVSIDGVPNVRDFGIGYFFASLYNRR